MVRSYQLFLVVTEIKCSCNEKRASRQKNPALQLYVRTAFSLVTVFFLPKSVNKHTIAQRCKCSVHQVDWATKFLWWRLIFVDPQYRTL